MSQNKICTYTVYQDVASLGIITLDLKYSFQTLTKNKPKLVSWLNLPPRGYVEPHGGKSLPLITLKLNIFIS